MFRKNSWREHWLGRPLKTAEPKKPCSKAAIKDVLRSVPSAKIGAWEAIKCKGHDDGLLKLDLGHGAVITNFQLYLRTEMWKLSADVRFIHNDLEAVYKQILAIEVPIDAPIAFHSTSRNFFTKEELIAAMASSMTEIETWAATVSSSAFIDAAAKRGPGEQPQRQIWHIVALAQTGNVELLRIYKDRFDRGERAQYPSFITADTVQRAIDCAQA